MRDRIKKLALMVAPLAVLLAAAAPRLTFR